MNSSSLLRKKLCSLCGRARTFWLSSNRLSSLTSDDYFRSIDEILPAEPKIVRSVFPQSELKHCDTLLQFFDSKRNWGKAPIDSGDSWTVNLLRLKSNKDLHQLWFVLLKERNVLLTLDREAEFRSMNTPSPERLEKVEVSMENILSVVDERDKAFQLLEKGPVPRGAYAWNLFGFRYWKRFKEHSEPWWENKNFKLRNQTYRSYVIPWMRLRLETKRRREFAKRSASLRALKWSRNTFPDVPHEDLNTLVNPMKSSKFNLSSYMARRKKEILEEHQRDSTSPKN